METTSLSLSSYHFLPPPNFPKILAFSSAKPCLSSPATSRTTISTPAPIRRSRIGRISRGHGISGVRMSALELEPSLAVKTKAAEISNELKGTSIFLLGMNCTIKTNLGKLVADALRYYYFDSDSLVEQAAGGDSAAKSLRDSDEKSFHDSETEVLRQLSSMGRLVVCAGDGAVQSSANLAYMRHGISIWVDVPLDLVANEVLKREALSSDSDSYSEVLEELSNRYDEMREVCGTADAAVSLQRVASQLGYEDLETVTPQDMAVEALKEIEKLTRVKKMMEEAARPF